MGSPRPGTLPVRAGGAMEDGEPGGEGAGGGLVAVPGPQPAGLCGEHPPDPDAGRGSCATGASEAWGICGGGAGSLHRLGQD